MFCHSLLCDAAAMSQRFGTAAEIFNKKGPPKRPFLWDRPKAKTLRLWAPCSERQKPQVRNLSDAPSLRMLFQALKPSKD
jgi:hypothetical protein